VRKRKILLTNSNKGGEKLNKIIYMILGSMLVSTGCATTKPLATSHSYVSPDKMHMGFQISMHTGVPNTPIQTVMVVYHKYDKKPIAIVNGQTKTMDEKLFDDLLEIAKHFGAAAITGGFMIEAAKSGVDCPVAEICGTLVQVANQAGANADSTANSTQQN